MIIKKSVWVVAWICFFGYFPQSTIATDAGVSRSLTVNIDEAGKIIEFSFHNYTYAEVAKIISLLSGIRIDLKDLTKTKASLLAKDCDWDMLIRGLFGNVAQVTKISDTEYHVVGHDK